MNLFHVQNPYYQYLISAGIRVGFTLLSDEARPRHLVAQLREDAQCPVFRKPPALSHRQLLEPVGLPQHRLGASKRPGQSEEEANEVISRAFLQRVLPKRCVCSHSGSVLKQRQCFQRTDRREVVHSRGALSDPSSPLGSALQARRRSHRPGPLAASSRQRCGCDQPLSRCSHHAALFL